MSAEVKKEIQLEIAHVLFMDIVGYSKLSINDQNRAVEELNQVVRASEQFQLAEAAGRLLKIATGDGMALVFYTSPEAPAQCAIEISRFLKEHPRLQLRMGVHSGPVSGVIDVNGHANLAGAGLNMARRVMDCGDAGHILLSKHVAEDLEEYEQWRPLLHDLGTCEVKHGLRVGIASLNDNEIGNSQLPKKLQAAKRHRTHVRWAEVAIALLLLGAIVVAFVFLLRRPTRSAMTIVEKSIAVLPFENRSRDADNTYFADGIQDEILTRLAKIADLKVISRTSTQHYKSAPENLPDIARQLGVAHVLEGSVQKSADAVRVNVQLIKAANDSHVWADTFDRKLTYVFSVESDVAKAIADQLRVKLTGQEERVITARPTDSTEAYDAYLRGLAYNLKTSTTPTNLLAAQKYLRDAVRLDPKFALAWAMLSYVEATGYITQNLQPTVALREEIQQADETAANLQPNLGEAAFAKAHYYYSCLKDYDTAERYFEQARRLLPNNSQIPESLAYVARRRGQWDQSEGYFNEAERLDPRNVAMLTQRGQSYVSLRRFPEALRKYDQVLNITPDDVDTIGQKAAVLQAQGDLAQAGALVAPLVPPPDDSVTLEIQAYQAILERRPEPIIARLKELVAKPDPALGYINGELRFYLGWIHQVTGDHSAAEASWRQARTELEPFVKDQPENTQLLGDLAFTYANLGDKAAAMAVADRAMAAITPEKDALYGHFPLEIVARVAAIAGDSDRAVPALQKLLSVSYASAVGGETPLTPALLRLDSMFDPLRNDPRFQKLASGAERMK